MMILISNHSLRCDGITYIVNGVVTVSLVWALVFYELRRKWDKLESEAKGLSAIVAMITRYRVAWVIATILIPNWFGMVSKLLGGSVPH